MIKYLRNMKDRINSLDFLKLLAALFITNSHFIPLYKDISPSLATFGVHGNALFFFVSGYLLMLGFGKYKVSFVDWYKKKIRRLWPSVLLWVIISSIIWHKPLTVGKLCLAEDYWFIQSIMIDFALFYILVNAKILRRWGGKMCILKCMFLVSIIISVIYFFYMPIAEGSPYHTNFHFVCHFSIMVLGGLVYLAKERIKTCNFRLDLFLCILSFVTYFAILKIGKGQEGVRYYLQILSLLPLHTFCYYMFKVANYDWTGKLFNIPYFGRICFIIASLTLEIYIVQFAIITDRFNSVFPISILLVFCMIVFVAYFLKIVTSVFLQIMSNDKFSFKKACMI